VLLCHSYSYGSLDVYPKQAQAKAKARMFDEDKRHSPQKSLWDFIYKPKHGDGKDMHISGPLFLRNSHSWSTLTFKTHPSPARKSTGNYSFISVHAVEQGLLAKGPYPTPPRNPATLTRNSAKTTMHSSDNESLVSSHTVDREFKSPVPSYFSSLRFNKRMSRVYVKSTVSVDTEPDLFRSEWGDTIQKPELSAERRATIGYKNDVQRRATSGHAIDLQRGATFVHANDLRRQVRTFTR
jgi:hypothetical protein